RYIRGDSIQRRREAQLLVIRRNDDRKRYCCFIRTARRRGHGFRLVPSSLRPRASPTRVSAESLRSAKVRSRILPRGYRNAAKCECPLVDGNLSKSRAPAIRG